MGVIQNSINSALGSATQAVGLAKVGQEMQGKAAAESAEAQIGYNKEMKPLVKGVKEAETALQVSEAEAEFQKGEIDKALDMMEKEQKKVGGPKEAEGRKEWSETMFGEYPKERFDEKFYNYWDNQSTIAQQKLEAMQDTMRGQREVLENRRKNLSEQEPLAAQYYGVKNKNLVRVNLGGKK